MMFEETDEVKRGREKVVMDIDERKKDDDLYMFISNSKDNCIQFCS